ncbi:MAG: cell wall-active antibiotics response protein [Lachnospiraceae bacterium]|nr:cell wall-active antibiotics response protein [Lachnospiraceae bacterium]
MNRKSSGAVWGVMLILLGVLIGGKILDWFSFDLFFDGWWSLFLIIPCAVRFLTERGRRMSALKGLFAGVLLLMAAQGFIEFSMLLPLLLAGFLVLSGLRMLMPRAERRGQNDREREAWDREERKRRERERRRAEKLGSRRQGRYEDASDYRYSEEYTYFGGDPQGEPVDNADGSGEDYRFTAEDSPDFESQAEQFEWNQYANRGEYRRDYSDRAGSYGAYSGRTYPGGGRYGGAGQYGGGQYRTGAGNRSFDRADTSRNGKTVCTSVFSGKEIRFCREPFEGAVLSAVFGAIDLDLRDAVLYRDTVIEAISIMGGIDIHVPGNVRVIVSGTPILGGIDNRVKRSEPLPRDSVTVLVKATCVMGGIEIK